jgi:hypothetical protein
MKEQVIKILLIILLLFSGCGFDKDDPRWETEVFNEPTKIEKIYVGGCSIVVEAFVKVPPIGYERYGDNLHQLSVMYGDKGVSSYNAWDNLWVRVPCGVCITKKVGEILYAKFSVLDSRFSLIEWGCGSERPPIQNVLYVTSRYQNRNHVIWSPTRVSRPEVCDGAPILLDVTDICVVLNGVDLSLKRLAL